MEKQTNKTNAQKDKKYSHMKSNPQFDIKNPLMDCTHKNEKTATNNQWVSTGLAHYPDNRERRDGPGGEDADE